MRNDEWGAKYGYLTTFIVYKSIGHGSVEKGYSRILSSKMLICIAEFVFQITNI